MHRFFVSPLLLTLTLTPLFALCWVEGVITVWNLPGTGAIFAANPTEPFRNIFQHSCSIMGVVGGLGLAIWDLVRNRRDDSAATRLMPNLFWCGFYAFLLIVVNGVLFSLVASQITSIQTAKQVFWFPFLSAVVFNFTAILWAAIRSITTRDILTPRVLRGKLRERAHLG